MSREEVARQLEWSTCTIFRIETGRSRPQPGNVRTLIKLYGVTMAERDGLIQLTREAREARQPGWWHSFRDVLPNPYEAYIMRDSKEPDGPSSRSRGRPGRSSSGTCGPRGCGVTGLIAPQSRC